MALISKLLGGDAALDACAVRDSAHVTEGAVGDHVAKIQKALFRLDGLSIDPGEVTAKQYGPSTADAVLKFKKKRHIINVSYQATEDNIVGKKTIDALDKEMDALEKRGGGGGGPVGKRPLDAVTVWFNMFIPQVVPGLTVSSKTTPGSTVIIDDEALLFGVKIKRAIETNDRTFNSVLSSTVRSLMTSQATVDWRPAVPTVTQKHAGYFVWDVDPATHVHFGTARMLSNSSARFDVDVLNSTFAKLSAKLSVPHPFGSPFDLVGKMDVIGELKIDRGARRVDFDLKVDEFPAYEGYATETGIIASATLFAFGVPPGKKPRDLVWPPTRVARGSAVI